MLERAARVNAAYVENFTKGEVKGKTGSFPLTIETPSQIALQILNAVFFGLNMNDLQTYRERVNAVRLLHPRDRLTRGKRDAESLERFLGGLPLIAGIIAVFVLAVVIDILILLVGRLITPWARVRGAS